MKLGVKKLTEGAILPKYQTKGSSGFDLHVLEDVIIKPGETKLLRTGLAFDIPEGYELQIRPRSGLSLKSPLRIANAPGTIDQDYTSEVKIIVSNISTSREFSINADQRVAQAVLAPVIQAEIVLIESINETDRGGFGSTGDN